MLLKSIHIHRSSGDSYRGAIEFDDGKGSITLHLDKELAAKIIEACSEEVVSTAERLATRMTANLIQQIVPAAALTTDTEIDQGVLVEAAEAVQLATKRRESASEDPQD